MRKKLLNKPFKIIVSIDKNGFSLRIGALIFAIAKSEWWFRFRLGWDKEIVLGFLSLLKLSLGFLYLRKKWRDANEGNAQKR